MNSSILKKLSPKEPKFFPMLKDAADVIVGVSKMITECVRTYSHDSSVEYFRNIKELERKGDSILNAIFNELSNTFITPFDREDIHDLANAMDDVTDYINSVAKRIAIYHPEKIPDTAALMGQLLMEAADNIVAAVDELEKNPKDDKKITQHCHNLHDIEHRADDAYEHFIIELFQNEKNAVELIKLKDIMHELEQATDAAERVGKIIKTIIVKYA